MRIQQNKASGGPTSRAPPPISATSTSKMCKGKSSKATSQASTAASIAHEANGTKLGDGKAHGNSNPGNSNSGLQANPTPLSAMTSSPLDLTSVERRGQLRTFADQPKHKRIFDLEECPTYRPSEEEFKDPFEYVKNIYAEASKYGLCKIIPPESWKPDFAIDTEKFHFTTRKQELNSCEGSTRANLSYLDGLSKFHKQSGLSLSRLPYVDKKPLDLYRLKKAVEARGGFERVCKLKKWAEIGRDMGYSGKIMSSLSTSLKSSFYKWLLPYEEYLSLAKPGVHQKLEHEYGGPLTPSPVQSPNGNVSGLAVPLSLSQDSPIRNATELLQASLRDPPVSVTESPQPSRLSNVTTPPHNPPAPKSSSTPATNGVNAGQSAASMAVAPLPSRKRQFSIDGPGGSQQHDGEPENKDDSDCASRRSKRLRNIDHQGCDYPVDTIPTVAGSHMSLLRPSVPRIPKAETPSTEQVKCEICGQADDSLFIMCDSCDNVYHGACLDPPLREQPKSEWSCPRCLVGDGQFGFEEGSLYSLKQFQEKAESFKSSYFEDRMPYDPVLKCHRPVTEDDVEREFWRLVSSLEETVEVEYGADIHCTTHGSGFPTIERDPLNEYSTNPWNLNILPLHQDSLFRYIKSDVSGMTVPWVYVGMTFSTFCWHTEDHYAYSANYQHFGATKTWYGIPAEDAGKFEKAMKDAVPELFETQPDLLFQLVTLLPPGQLKKAGVRVYALDQHAGEFVLTFPQAYHAGFNHGFNFNEAVNFAPADWEPFGLAGIQRLQEFRKQPCFSHDELLFTAAEGTTSNSLTIKTAKWLAPAVKQTQLREQEQRNAFQMAHAHQSADTECSLSCGDTCPLRPQHVAVDVPEEEYQCCYCKVFTYLSRYKCHNSGKVLCLAHAASYPCCDVPRTGQIPAKNHSRIYRMSDEQINEVWRKVQDKADVPAVWEAKYLKLLDEEDKPSLKSLRSMLQEGEKIPWELNSLGDLKVFVELCNKWVSEAEIYKPRKQQTRRKGDKHSKHNMRKGSNVKAVAEEPVSNGERSLLHMDRLLEQAEELGFDCPEITMLQEKRREIADLQSTILRAINQIPVCGVQLEELEQLLEASHDLGIQIPEAEALSCAIGQVRWRDKCSASHHVMLSQDTLREMVEDGRKLGIRPENDHMRRLVDQLQQGIAWDTTVRKLLSTECPIHSQLDALFKQAKHNSLPVSQELLADLDDVLSRQRELQDLMRRSFSKDPHERPRYSEVVALMSRLEKSHFKPLGIHDLEKEIRRNEDWMRQGKRLFGKANAPLYILKSHLMHVRDRNKQCFELDSDKPRDPTEPASCAPSPDAKRKEDELFERPAQDVFCLCRQSEAGLMIECELCHEWYHGKCLKVSRGKVKDEDKYTCPICDYRVKIPRDASRPRLEDLMSWRDEISSLPFRPDEEELLEEIINDALHFRQYLEPCCNEIFSTCSEAETQRFYLRKIEGAEVLLTQETNFFRQQLHKWFPVAPEPPPLIAESKSTRKPRPTKLQRLLAAHQVEELDQLPDEVRSRALSLKRRSDACAAAAAAAAVAEAKMLNGVSPRSPQTTVVKLPPAETSPIDVNGYSSMRISNGNGPVFAPIVYDGGSAFLTSDKIQQHAESAVTTSSRSVPVGSVLADCPTEGGSGYAPDESLVYHGGSVSQLGHAASTGPAPYGTMLSGARPLELDLHSEEVKRRAPRGIEYTLPPMHEGYPPPSSHLFSGGAVLGSTGLTLAPVRGGGSGGPEEPDEAANNKAMDKLFIDLTNADDD